jgi:hypothetical protein
MTASTPRAKAPAAAARPARVERVVQRRGHDHAAQGGYGREGGLAHRGELARDQLTLDLQADDEEEDPHQAVVDPMVQRLLQHRAAHVDAGLDLQQVVVAVVPWRVGPEDGDHRAAEEQARARELVMEERLERVQQTVDGTHVGDALSGVPHGVLQASGNEEAARRVRHV